MTRRAFYFLSVILLICMGCDGVPPPVPEFDLASLTGSEDSLNPYVIRAIKHDYRRTSFKYRYVYHDGTISTFDRGGYRLRVDATYAVSDHAHEIAACTAKKMTQHMSSSIFNNLASKTKIGIFTKTETLLVYPEYYAYANPAGCGSSCAGSCRTSCTFDGRKYYTLAGAGGKRTAILDDNILCNSADPYRSINNILVHEFSHTVKNYGLSSAQRSQVNTAYNHAKTARIWADHYPMATVEEYFAVGSAVYFNVDNQRYRGNGNHIDLCSGSNVCTSEYESRTHLYKLDNQLYNILTRVYTNNNPGQYANIGVCGRVC